MLNSSSRNMASVRLGGSDRKVDPSSTGLTLSDDDVFGAVGVKIGCSSRDAEIDGVGDPTEQRDRTASAVREGVAGRQKRESELMRGDARGSKLRLRGGGCGPSKSSSDPVQTLERIWRRVASLFRQRNRRWSLFRRSQSSCS